MELIDRCSSCKHLIYAIPKTYECNKLKTKVSIVYKINYIKIKPTTIISIINNPNEFGCIAWEAKDETN